MDAQEIATRPISCALMTCDLVTAKMIFVVMRLVLHALGPMNGSHLVSNASCNTGATKISGPTALNDTRKTVSLGIEDDMENCNRFQNPVRRTLSQQVPIVLAFTSNCLGCLYPCKMLMTYVKHLLFFYSGLHCSKDAKLLNAIRHCTLL